MVEAPNFRTVAVPLEPTFNERALICKKARMMTACKNSRQELTDDGRSFHSQRLRELYQVDAADTRVIRPAIFSQAEMFFGFCPEPPRGSRDILVTPFRLQ